MTPTPHPKRLTAAQLAAYRIEAEHNLEMDDYTPDLVYVDSSDVLSLITELESHRAAARRGQRTRRTGTKRKGSK